MGVQVAEALPVDARLEAMRQRPVYVVLGVQGSGTNLLSKVLTRVFGFSVLHDRSLVFNTAARIGPMPAPGVVAGEIARFRTLLAPGWVHRKLGRPYMRKNMGLEGLASVLTPDRVRSGSEFARLVYAYRACSLGAREMAIKSDDLWEHIGDIDAVLPNRRILLLTRDFRDNLVSIAGKPFGPVDPLRAAAYVKQRFAFYEAEYLRAGATGYHVRFETLVEAPDAFVTDFARHFGIEPVTSTQQALGTIQRRSGRVGRWKGLGGDTLAWCEGLLERELCTYGYPLASGAAAMPSELTMAVARTRDAIDRVPQKLRRVMEHLRR